MKRTLGPHVAAWIETNLCHGPGDIQGEPITLDPEMLRFIFDAYVIDDEGRRVVKEATWSRPKGRAKSELAGMLCCAEAMGPVRFAGWDRRGYPLAQPVTSPFVRIAATEEEQSGNVYDNVVFMLTHGPLADTPGLDVGLTRTFVPGGGEIVPSTASAASKDGGKETFVVFDESHLYTTPELHRMHKTIRRNLVKRKIAQPWSMDATTMFEPGMESVAELNFRRWEAMLEAGVDDPSFLFDHLEAPRIKDWDDDAEVLAALTVVYGPAAEWMALDEIAASRKDPKTKRHEFARYFLNQVWGAGDLSLIDDEAWMRLAVSGGPFDLVAQGARVCIGMDGSRSHDQAVIAHATPPDDDGVIHADLVVHDVRRDRLPDPMWPHELHDGAIDYEELADSLTERFQTFRVAEAAYGADYVGEATQVIDRRIPESRVAKIPRTSKIERAALGALDTVLTAGKLRHRGDPILRRQLANTLVIREPDTGTILRLRPRKPSEPIHAVYALAFAVWRAQMPKPGAGVKERGIRFVDPTGVISG